MGQVAPADSVRCIRSSIPLWLPKDASHESHPVQRCFRSVTGLGTSTCLINTAVSMGRRNTQLESWFLTVSAKQIASSEEVLADQLIGWCCIDRLSRQH